MLQAKETLPYFSEGSFIGLELATDSKKGCETPSNSDLHPVLSFILHCYLLIQQVLTVNVKRGLFLVFFLSKKKHSYVPFRWETNFKKIHILLTIKRCYSFPRLYTQSSTVMEHVMLKSRKKNQNTSPLFMEPRQTCCFAHTFSPCTILLLPSTVAEETKAELF